MENLKRLFSTLVIYRHNIQMLHWKVTGEHFDCVHALMDEYTKQFNEFIDAVAEIMLMTHASPLCLDCCLEFAKNDEHYDYVMISGKEDYSGEDCFAYIDRMFHDLIVRYNEVKNHDMIPADLASVFDNHVYWLRTEVVYKNKRRRIG